MSPNKRTTTINFVNSLQLKSSIIITERKSWFLKGCSKISEHKRYAAPTRIVPILELWINEEKVRNYAVIKSLSPKIMKMPERVRIKSRQKEGFQQMRNVFKS